MATKSNTRADEQIAEDVQRALRLDNDVPDERIRVEVNDGMITLEGSVDQSVQKEAAQDAANKVLGVRGVSNRIVVLPAM